MPLPPNRPLPNMNAVKTAAPKSFSQTANGGHGMASWLKAARSKHGAIRRIK